jgi:hypothetical protein
MTLGHFRPGMGIECSLRRGCQSEAEVYNFILNTHPVNSKAFQISLGSNSLDAIYSRTETGRGTPFVKMMVLRSIVYSL